MANILGGCSARSGSYQVCYKGAQLEAVPTSYVITSVGTSQSVLDIPQLLVQTEGGNGRRNSSQWLTEKGCNNAGLMYSLHMQVRALRAGFGTGWGGETASSDYDLNANCWAAAISK